MRPCVRSSLVIAQGERGEVIEPPGALPARHAENVCVLIEHDGQRPRVAESAYVAPTAVLCGDVTVGDDSRVLFGAVLTAEGGTIEVGSRCIVMENALIRGRPGHPALLGDNVLVGPHAHVNGAMAERDAFLATGVSIFPGARVGAGSEIRINAVVQVNSSVPERTTVPIGWIAVGDPAQLFPPEAHEELWPLQRAMDFPGTVYGIERDQFTMEKVARGYAERFGRHRDDRVVE
jgi:carbonic anhydrase/acetyltransferase-like protein (isoleucine patch superfamily)